MVYFITRAAITAKSFLKRRNAVKLLDILTTLMEDNEKIFRKMLSWKKKDGGLVRRSAALDKLFEFYRQILEQANKYKVDDELVSLYLKNKFIILEAKVAIFKFLHLKDFREYDIISA